MSSHSGTYRGLFLVSVFVSASDSLPSFSNQSSSSSDVMSADDFSRLGDSVLDGLPLMKRLFIDESTSSRRTLSE